MPNKKKLHWTQTQTGRLKLKEAAAKQKGIPINSLGQIPEKVEGQPLSEVTQATLAGYSKSVDKPSNSYIVRIERPDRTVIEVIERNY